jgi:excisionase family DNA binding protein
VTTEYNVIGIVDVAPTERRADQWIDALIDYSPAVGRTSRGLSELIITLPARDIVQAVRTGTALLVEAVGQLSEVHAMTTEAFDQRINDAPMPDFVGATEAATILGVSRQRIQQLAAVGRLPSTRVGNAIAIPRQALEVLIPGGDQVDQVRSAK